MDISYAKRDAAFVAFPFLSSLLSPREKERLSNVYELRIQEEVLRGSRARGLRIWLIMEKGGEWRALEVGKPDAALGGRQAQRVKKETVWNAYERVPASWGKVRYVVVADTHSPIDPSFWRRLFARKRTTVTLHVVPQALTLSDIRAESARRYHSEFIARVCEIDDLS